MKTILFILTLLAANIDYAQDHGVNGVVWDNVTDAPADGASYGDVTGVVIVTETLSYFDLLYERGK